MDFGSEGRKGAGSSGALRVEVSPAVENGVEGTRLQVRFSLLQPEARFGEASIRDLSVLEGKWVKAPDRVILPKP